MPKGKPKTPINRRKSSKKALKGIEDDGMQKNLFIIKEKIKIWKLKKKKSNKVLDLNVFWEFCSDDF